ncbi:MAG: hypothetical protein KatS3mg060_3027 [Dehalococcoidia bacterium]|nr:MAG: hypothetical protein KatS3mg060_3027 [Dehalococcoidia bacterium]
MIRRVLTERAVNRRRGITWRGRDVSRLEGLTDAVFGFAITLLVVSLEVPNTFDELQREMLRFPAFVISFALLLLLWHAHYSYFRRYGLEDLFTIVVNSLFLFVVLFYVYPLKFLFTWLIDEWLGLPTEVPAADGSFVPILKSGDVPLLMTFYGAGLMAVGFCFVLFNWHALRLADTLKLSARERIETQGHLWEASAHMGIAMLSIACAWYFRDGTLSGLVYVLYGVVGVTFGRWTEHRARRAEARQAA